MRAVLVTGTDIGVGKTRMVCDLASRGRIAGLRVGVMKPAETGCREVDDALWPEDAHALKAAARSTVPVELICPYRYRSPLAPAAAAELDGLPVVELDTLKASFEQIRRRSDCVLVEGAGGIRVPLQWGFDYADLALALGLEVVVVVANRLGCLNAALLTFAFADARGLQVRGYILNDCEPTPTAAASTNRESLRRLTDVPLLDHVYLGGTLTDDAVGALLGC